jgi:endogenous inhibitor of DNA gyrase (YacG/DUF329 family)
MINENEYRGLREHDRQFIKEFNIDLVNDTALNKDEFYIYEINCPDIKAVTHLHNYTWIHLWRPFCSAEYCQNIAVFEYAAEKYRSAGLVFLLISETYGIKTIQEIVRRSSFSLPVYVLKDSYFGHKLKGARTLISDQLHNNDSIRKNIYQSDYIFQDSLLIYASGTLYTEKLDSIMSHQIKE